MQPNQLIDFPRSMKNPAQRSLRKKLLKAPHMAPLTEYTARLRAMKRGVVPEFEPLDGGIEARALFLFKKPGPMTVAGSGGSGFISRNNDDPTAEATFNFMQSAEIPRNQTITWNVIPWWNKTLEVTGSELAAGVRCLHELIALLPKLRAVVFVGKDAEKASSLLADTELVLISSAMPTRQVKNIYPDLWDAIPSDWAKVKPYLDT